MPDMVFTNLVKKGQKFMKKKNLAFTLAEVLIVIGIIGVVAALTLPNLNHATGDKETVTRVKKIYSTLNEAFDRAQVVYGPYSEWFNNIDENDAAAVYNLMADRILQFTKTSKTFKYLEKDTNNLCYDWYCGAGAIFPDGSEVGFSEFNNLPPMPGICVDIDGPNRGKSRLANDVFIFSIMTKNGVSSIVPLPFSENVDFSNLSGNYISYNNPDDVEYIETCGYYTAWVIENGNLDYLKCPEELNWETKRSCE